MQFWERWLRHWLQVWVVALYQRGQGGEMGGVQTSTPEGGGCRRHGQGWGLRLQRSPLSAAPPFQSYLPSRNKFCLTFCPTS